MKNSLYTAVSLFLLLVMTTGCSSGDEGTEAAKLSVFGVTINGMDVNGTLGEVPVNTIIEVKFSSAVNQQAFQNALSITDGSGAVPFEVSYQNAAATARITLTDLAPQTEHTFQLMSGALGAKGERLQDAINFSFTTDAGNSYSACTTGTADCLRTFLYEEAGVEYNFQFYSNYDVTNDPGFVWNDIKNLIVVVHGQNRDADEYFRIMNQAIAGTALQGNTLVVAPYFKDDAAAEGNAFFWGSNWRFGGDTNNTQVNMSSFSVVDALISAFTSSAKFPDMKTVFVTGHSSGASFSHYYSLSSGIESLLPSVNFEYSALNSQYFFYPTDQRFDEDTNTWYTPTTCAGFNYWPYGYEMAPSYLEGTDKNTVVQRLGSMNAVLFHGENDTSTTGTLNTDDCQAVLLGSDRLERGRNYNNYLNTYFPGNTTDFTIVPNAAHDAATMFGSEEFKTYLENRMAN